LAETLREAREAAGLRQADLAERLGRDQTFVSLYEVGQRRIDVVEFRRIALALGLDPVQLFITAMDSIGNDDKAQR
jgi:transcriptional regulator with XRE-family HTH domain